MVYAKYSPGLLSLEEIESLYSQNVGSPPLLDMSRSVPPSYFKKGLKHSAQKQVRKVCQVHSIVQQV